MSMLTQIARRVASRYARFHEGPQGEREFDQWMKDQPESFQEDWEANTEEYGDQFKTAAGGDPYWMTANFPSKDSKGRPVRKGDRVFYYPRTRTMLSGAEAEEAARDFDAARADEEFMGGW